jgi:prepilin-type N-terminal cleavage/methylation domain-containing protein
MHRDFCMLTHPAPAQRRQGGFTLIELSVVIVVVALLLGSLLIPLNNQTRQRNMAETQRILEDTREALIGYALANGRLPRPAVSETDAAERPQCATNAQCVGPIPWAILGTPKTDAWGKVIYYSVSIAFSNDSGFGLTTSGTRDVSARDGAGTVVPEASNVPAVVYSFGFSNHGKTTDGAALPDGSTSNDDEDVNATHNGSAAIIHRSFTENPSSPGGEFDDQVIWLSRHVLVNRMVAAGRLP